MVKGSADLRKRLAKVPKLVRKELRKQLEKEATKIVAEMNTLKPIPEIDVDWTWGEAPKGSLTIGTVNKREFGKISITIYATARTEEYSDIDGFPAVARWFEFGTAPRFHKSGKSTGQISANPYFWPVFRANKSRVRGNIRASVNRAMKKA